MFAHRCFVPKTAEKSEGLLQTSTDATGHTGRGDDRKQRETASRQQREIGVASPPGSPQGTLGFAAGAGASPCLSLEVLN